MTNWMQWLEQNEMEKEHFLTQDSNVNMSFKWLDNESPVGVLNKRKAGLKDFYEAKMESEVTKLTPDDLKNCSIEFKNDVDFIGFDEFIMERPRQCGMTYMFMKRIKEQQMWENFVEDNPELYEKPVQDLVTNKSLSSKTSEYMKLIHFINPAEVYFETD